MQTFPEIETGRFSISGRASRSRHQSRGRSPVGFPRRPPSSRLRFVALLAACAVAWTPIAGCATLLEQAQRFDEVAPVAEDVAPPPESFEPLRAVVYRFRNSANVESFSVIPDGEYSGDVLNEQTAAPNEAQGYAGAGDSSNSIYPPARRAAERDAEAQDIGAKRTRTENDASVTEGQTQEAAPETVNPAGIAREITETELFRSGRFTLENEQLFQQRVERLQREQNLDEAAAVRQAAQETEVGYIIYGDLTNFEIRQQRDYWQVPLWVIVLVGSFFIQDDDLRVWIWYSMLRAATIIPLNSEFWDYGLEWENMEVVVEVDLDLRMVDARSGSIVYAESAGVRRLEKVRNLNLMVWASDNSLKITRSNAGRQMRFAAKRLTADLSEFVDRQYGPPPAQPSGPDQTEPDQTEAESEAETDA